LKSTNDSFTGVIQTLKATFLVITLALVAVLTGTAPLKAAETPRFAWTASISADSTVTTAEFNVSFAGLQSTSAVQLKLQPTNLVVGDGFSSAEGSAQFSFKIPSNTSAGDYSINAAGISNSGNAFAVVVATFTVAPTGIVSDSTVRDGVLTLEMPAGAAATFQEPVIENGLSVTFGSLGAFVVRDDRSVTKPGWIVTASVSTLALATDNSVTMASTQLGIEPYVVSGGTGVNPGQATVAGNAVYPFVFAEAPLGVQVSTTTLNGNLKLLAPQELPVGTYVGTITITLVSR
jgi:hypothetical protein